MAERRATPATRRSRLAAGILLGGIVASLAAFSLSRSAETARSQARFDAAVAEAQDRLHERLRAFEDLLRSLRGYVQSGGHLDVDRFREFFAALDLERRYAGLLGVSYGVVLAPGGEAAMEARLQAEHRDPSLRIHPGTGFEGDTIVLFAEPAPLNAAALGFNSASSSEQRDSLLQARDTGELQASGPMAVAQAPTAGPGLVLRLAVYRADGPLETVESRRRSYVGCANAIFLLARLAEYATERLSVDGIRVRMADITDPLHPIPFLEGGRDAPMRWWHRLGLSNLHEYDELPVAGRRWALDISAGPAFFEAAESLVPWLVGLTVLFISALLFALVRSVSLTGQRARDLADRMTESLRLSESRLRALTRVMPDLILVLDADGRYREVHTGDPSILVAPAGTMLQHTMRDLLPPDLAERAIQTIRRALAEARVVSMEYSVVARRGPVHLEARVAPMDIPIDGQACVLWVARDVTERRAQEEAHLQAQKLEGLGLLAGGIAHDFNNLLAAIQGHLALGRLALDERRDPVPHLERMNASIRRAADLARQLLAYSGHVAFHVEYLDLNRLVEEMSELLAVSRSRKVTLDVRLAKGLPPIRGDRSQLQQVVMNLVTNAAEAVGNEVGLVTLATSSSTLSAEDIAHRMPDQGLAPGPFVTLVVTDTGCGMSDEVLSRIFDPFFTTKPTGRGLGLSALRGILRSHEAGIEIQSTVGAGSTFSIHFPACEGAVARRSDSGITPHTGTPLGGTLLVTDDEPVLRDIARAMAEHLGFQVIEAEDGEKAWDLFSARHGELAGILMDLTMPRMGGAELYRRIREVAPRFPIVLCSGYNREALPALVDPEEPTAFLQKPYSFAALEAALREALAHPLPDSPGPH